MQGLTLFASVFYLLTKRRMTQYSSATVITIDQLQISPPPGSVLTTPIPLNFFDIPWLSCHPIQRVFFYDFPVSHSQFCQSIIPNLTSSLSLALRYFYPLAARFIALPWPNMPYILYSDGDSVPFTVAESTTLEFDQITSNQPNDVTLLHPLLPKLPPSEVNADSTPVSSLLAVKVTLFPNSGICIGIESAHVAADGMAFNNFLKSWASISKSGGKDLSRIQNSPPCLDRELIKDPKDFKTIYLEHLWKPAKPWDEKSVQHEFVDKVRATFVVDREDISRLKKLVNSRTQLQASAFTVTSALVWTNLTKSQHDDGDDDEGKLDTYIFPADCRGRMEPKMPATYFGNCLSGVMAVVKRRDLMGEDGIFIAAEEIGVQIKELERGGAMKHFETLLPKYLEVIERGKRVSVAGSPKFGVYETDFGWGRPRKAEQVHIDFAGSVYFSDSRDVERGGIEFAVALTRGEMDAFVAGFEKQLKELREA